MAKILKLFSHKREFTPQEQQTRDESMGKGLIVSSLIIYFTLAVEAIVVKHFGSESEQEHLPLLKPFIDVGAIELLAGLVLMRKSIGRAIRRLIHTEQPEGDGFDGD